MNNQFPIFIKSNKFYIKKSSVFFIASFISSIIVFNFHKEIYFEFVFLPILTFVLTFVFKTIEAFSYKFLNGAFDGNLIFHSNGLTCKKTFYKLEDLNKIEINNFDYKGFQRQVYGSIFNDGFSQGVNNRIILKIENNNKLVVFNFLQMEAFELQNVKEYLIEYHLAGKLHFLNLIDCLNIVDYDEIQKFKKEMYS